MGLTTVHDAAALRHYEALIAERYPPHLAALLAAMRYHQGLGVDSLPLPALREALVATQDNHPDLSRDAGRLRVAVEEKVGVPTTKARRKQ